MQEGLGPHSKMQLQTSALLSVQWPELTTQSKTLRLGAFLGRKQRLEAGVLPFRWLSQPKSKYDLPGSEVLRRQGCGLELLVFGAGDAGNPQDPTGRRKGPLAASPTPSQCLSHQDLGSRAASTIFFFFQPVLVCIH